ncbi:MAG: hypothetical protein CVU38_13845 [Chloroflexi bacterium HGW-Chloroflexi-1]|nr:MAG: hypothetical protein CVU38_13845 [Chloroflexi bacterium HGW-Chloroflexi-1]
MVASLQAHLLKDNAIIPDKRAFANQDWYTAADVAACVRWQEESAMLQAVRWVGAADVRDLLERRPGIARPAFLGGGA